MSTHAASLAIPRRPIPDGLAKIGGEWVRLIASRVTEQGEERAVPAYFVDRSF